MTGWVLYTLPMNISGYAPFRINTSDITYEQKWVCPIPNKYVGHYCEEVKYAK